MKLVFIHGRSQGKRTQDEICAEWTTALLSRFTPKQRDAFESIEVRVPYYGKVLDELASAQYAKVSDSRKRGAADPDLDPDISVLAEEIRTLAGTSGSDVRQELPGDQQDRGPGNWEWVHAIGRAVSKRIPWLTEEIFERFVADVDAYLKFPESVDEVVRADFDTTEPVVVVSHSLGTVVGYHVLTGLPTPPNIPLFVTLGSPLAIPTIKRKMSPPPLGIPAGVRQWLNASDERDGVALFSRLDRDSFIAGIQNVSDLHNPRENPHWIGGYLGDEEISRLIAEALALS